MCGCWPGYQNISNICTNQCGTSSYQLTSPTTTNSYPIVCPCISIQLKWDPTTLKCVCYSSYSAYNKTSDTC
jgi:hypothetical protein